MANSILVNTDILIDVACNVENAIIYLDSQEKDAILRISTVTQMELIVGCRNKKELKNLANFLVRFEIVKFERRYR